MFDAYVLARKKSMPRWVPPTVAAAILVHAAALSGVIVHGYWAIEALPMPKSSVEMVVPPPAPPPPAGRPAVLPAAGPKQGKLRPPPRDPTQPVRITAAEPTQGGGGSGDATAGGGSGSGDGPGSGDCVGITCSDDGPPVIPGSDPPDDGGDTDPPIVSQAEIDRQFLSGQREIHPDAGTRARMDRDGVTLVRPVMKLCLDGGGRVASIDTIASSGYPEYDAKIRSIMRSWRYKPFKNGAHTTVCAPVTFIYTIR